MELSRVLVGFNSIAPFLCVKLTPYINLPAHPQCPGRTRPSHPLCPYRFRSITTQPLMM